MYKDQQFPASILIVKTSSLGDIVQCFNVLDDLRKRFPTVSIDWAVEEIFCPIVSAHPLVRRAIGLDLKRRRNLWEGLKSLRRDKYDLVFDLQGNCKSGVVTFLSRGKVKVGYGFHAVREWPNILATDVRLNVSKQNNIRDFYLGLIDQYFEQSMKREFIGHKFNTNEAEEKKVAGVLEKIPSNYRIMVCPGSKWPNKQLNPVTLISFLKKIEETYGASFLLIWGDDSEKKLCNEINASLKNSTIVDRLPIPTWQNLMNEVDLVIAVDSSALHLCATTSTPSFSIFGPTSSNVFKPLGKKHCFVQGTCPYGQKFEKQCPVLRSCPTGACIKNLSVEELFEAFQNQRTYLQL